MLFEIEAIEVAICIATYLRPEGLWRVLQSLSCLTFARSGKPRMEVVVIDNDPLGSARATCERAAAEMHLPVRYVHEPKRGIAQVRNTAVVECRDRAEMIAFIDDDETADPRWLDELLSVQREHDADAVLGPAVRIFECEPPGWLRHGQYFEQRRYRTGTRIRHGGIGNALIHTRCLSGRDPAFDERLGLTGGEDTFFFLCLARSGARIVWADDATIYESVPPYRATLPWILRRVYRTANTWSFCEVELDGTVRVITIRILKGVSRIGLGMLLLPAALLFGKRALVRALWNVSYGVGNLTGLVGFRYEAYRDVAAG